MKTGGSNHEHGNHRCGCVATPRHFRSTWRVNARRQRLQRHCRQSMVIFGALTRMVANILVARPGTDGAVDGSFEFSAPEISDKTPFIPVLRRSVVSLRLISHTSY